MRDPAAGAVGWTDEVIDVDVLLSSLVGCAPVKERMQRLKALHEYYQDENDFKAQVNFNYIFTGAPGTGKTTVARKMGQMFCSLGLIPFSEVVETSPSKMQTGYVGQTAKQTREIFRSALGKVLFIDEAYGLNPTKGGQFMQEAVDEIVQMLTDPEFKGKMIVILAGYEGDISEMLKVNAGLQSRFTEKIAFEDFSVDQIASMMRKLMPELDETVAHTLNRIAVELKGLDNFSNGRDVETFCKSTNMARIVRLLKNKSTLCNHNKAILDVDLDEALDELIKSRNTPDSKASKPQKGNVHKTQLSPPAAVATQNAVSRNVKKKAASDKPKFDSNNARTTTESVANLETEKQNPILAKENAIESREDILVESNVSDRNEDMENSLIKCEPRRQRIS